MLVVTRKPQEVVHIGNGITVTVVRVKGQSVRIGIEAPSDVRVVRAELLNADSPADQARSEKPAAVETTVPADAPAGISLPCTEASKLSPCAPRTGGTRATLASLRQLAARRRRMRDMHGESASDLS